jgi:hypothetical protein
MIVTDTTPFISLSSDTQYSTRETGTLYTCFIVHNKCFNKVTKVSPAPDMTPLVK